MIDYRARFPHGFRKVKVIPGRILLQANLILREESSHSEACGEIGKKASPSYLGYMFYDLAYSIHHTLLAGWRRVSQNLVQLSSKAPLIFRHEFWADQVSYFS